MVSIDLEEILLLELPQHVIEDHDQTTLDHVERHKLYLDLQEYSDLVHSSSTFILSLPNKK